MTQTPRAESTRRVTSYEAMLRSLLVQALRGNMTATKLIAALMTRQPQLREAAATQACVEAEIAAQRRAGIAKLL